jgi:hypothetical protein
MPNSSVIAHALLIETESKLEPAFRKAPRLDAGPRQQHGSKAQAAAGSNSSVAGAEAAAACLRASVGELDRVGHGRALRGQHRRRPHARHGAHARQSGRGRLTRGGRVDARCARNGVRHILQTGWLPHSSSACFVLTTQFLRVYDLAQDKISLAHAFQTRDDQIKDVAFMPHGGGSHVGTGLVRLALTARRTEKRHL